MKKMYLSFFVCYSMVTAQDFPRGVFLGTFNPSPSDTEAIYIDLRDTLNLNTVSATVNSPSHELFTKSFDIIARELNLWEYSTGQQMIYKAEDIQPEEQWERNYFATRGGENDGSFRRMRKNFHSVGYMVKEAVPDSEYNFLQYGRKWYTAKFIMKADTAGIAKTARIADVRVYSISADSVKDSLQLRAYNFGGSGSLKTFEVHFSVDSLTCPTPPIKIPKWDKLTGGAQLVSSALNCQEKIDLQIYWYNNADTWLDKVIVEDDSVGRKLFAGNLTSSTISSANAFASAYKLNRYYLFDEPPVSSLLGYNYVDNILDSIGADRGFTPTFYTESKIRRFIADAQPKEIVVDNYVISPWIPVPVSLLSSSEATALGIASYEYSLYRHRLQVNIDTLDWFFYSAATEAKNNSKKFWYIAQTHGIYNIATSNYIVNGNGLRPPTGNELKATIGMALAYGAKGIFAWPYRYTFDSSGYIYTGLVDSIYHHNSNNFSYGGVVIFGGYSDMFNGFAQSMSKIKSIGSTLSQLTWQATKRWHHTHQEFIQEFGTWSGLISDVITKTTAGVVDTNWQYIVETGHLEDASNNDYILAVNRRCDTSDTRNITFTMGTMNGFKQITNLTTNKKFIVCTGGSFTDTFAPGEFTLYKVEEMPFTWSGDITVMNTVTVANGTTLTVNSNTTLRFASDVSLIVNGVLNADGSSPSTQITFTSVSGTSAGSWGSIQMNGSGANGSSLSFANMTNGTQIDALNCEDITIQNCTIQTMINGVNGYSASGWILNNTIIDVRDHGIILTNASFTCNQNVIQKTPEFNYYHTGGAIIYNGGSSGDLWQNDISGFEWGVGTLWGSSTTFYSADNEGRNNRIINCLYGVRAYQNGFAFICPPWSYEPYWGSSIYDNNPYNIHWASGGECFADYTYWGGEPPIRFYFDQSCQPDYSNWLTDDPWFYYLNTTPLPQLSGKTLLSESGKIHGKKLPVTLGKTGDSKESLFDGIRLLKMKKYIEAMDFFLTYIAKNPNNKAAYVELLHCYNIETAKDITDFFTSLPNSAAKEHQLLRSYLYLKQRDIKSAKEINRKIVAENPGTPLAVKAQLTNFYIALFDENDATSASAILAEVSNKSVLSNSMELSIAQDALNAERKRGFSQPKEMPFSLSGSGLSKNYPNPFNPTTTIAFLLPQANNVTLEVFDALGRKVVTLMNEFKSEGQHNVKFDASLLASGIYFYRLQSGSYVETKKLVLMK